MSRKKLYFAVVLFFLVSLTLTDAKTAAVECNDLYGLKIDSSAELVKCRTLPFLAAAPENRGSTNRKLDNVSPSETNPFITDYTKTPPRFPIRISREIIPVGAKADTIYFLGMMNNGWDYGVEFWNKHPELAETRDDQVYVGSKIGELEIVYANGKSDRIPLVMGATAWFVSFWASMPEYGYMKEVKEPFASRPDYAAIFVKSLKIKESSEPATGKNTYAHYFLAVKPRDEKIERIIISDNPGFRGSPLISAITLAGASPVEGLHPFGKWQADANDLKPTVNSYKCGNWSKELTALTDALYTKESDLPKKIELIDFPAGFDAASIRFKGDIFADMLSNIWIANLMQIDEKFDANDGFFHETGKNSPWYGAYSGIGTWAPVGIYNFGAWGRSSEHFATLALRCINDSKRLTNYVDFCDKYLYSYRNNHDPNKGPDNTYLDISRWPADAPPHWGTAVYGYVPEKEPYPINELQGDEEMEGHGATIVARWVAWRMFGAPKGDWLTAQRKDIYGKSRYDATRDAAEFICWLMEYTGRDVIYSEGEITGWGGGGTLYAQGWKDEKDPKKILRNYADADMYEPYASYVCMTALRCSAQMAEAAGDIASAVKWRAYADRIQTTMIRLLATGEYSRRMWRQSRCSVMPSLQDSLVQAWFAFYYDGLDPMRLDKEMTPITQKTLKRQLSYPYGHAPVLAMGYGIGWLTKAALVLDEMDDAGKLLVNIAKYSYDKNMDYVDQKRNIDWRKWLWLIPEGTNILPDGSWYRIGDLSNGANQGPAMHALELCAGIDDTKPTEVKIMPRVPSPLTGIEIRDFPVLIPDGNGLTRAKINYAYDRNKFFFTFSSDHSIPNLAVRLGPFDHIQAEKFVQNKKNNYTVRTESSGTYNGMVAWWVWYEGFRNVTSLYLNK